MYDRYSDHFKLFRYSHNKAFFCQQRNVNLKSLLAKEEREAKRSLENASTDRFITRSLSRAGFLHHKYQS
jgi:hypothetical protein